MKQHHDTSFSPFFPLPQVSSPPLPIAAGDLFLILTAPSKARVENASGFPLLPFPASAPAPFYYTSPLRSIQPDLLLCNPSILPHQPSPNFGAWRCSVSIRPAIRCWSSRNYAHTPHRALGTSRDLMSPSYLLLLFTCRHSIHGIFPEYSFILFLKYPFTSKNDFPVLMKGSKHLKIQVFMVVLI